MRIILNKFLLILFLLITGCFSERSFNKVVERYPFQENIPLKEKLPSIEISFPTIEGSYYKEYITKDFSKIFVEEGEKKNGKILIYFDFNDQRKFKIHKFIADYLLFTPLNFTFFLGMPLFKISGEYHLTAIVFNKKNDIVKRYTGKSSYSYWINLYNNATGSFLKKDVVAVINALESIKRDIKNDAQFLKQELLSAE